MRRLSSIKISNRYLKTLDVYIIRKFLGTFFFSISLLIIIVIVFDISEKIDDFIKNEAPLNEIIFSYYLNFVPYFVNLFMYLFTFIAVIFFTSKMASNTEIVAILCSGIGFRRMMRPYMIAATFLALLSFLLANFIIPYTNQGMLAFERKYVLSQKLNRDMNIHQQIGPETYIYMENYDIPKAEGWKFSMEKIGKQGLYYKLTSDKINWDSIRSLWVIGNYYVRTISGMKETLRSGVKLDTILNTKLADFETDIEDVKVMNYAKLRKFIKEKRAKGAADISKYEVKKYERIAFPFATIILTLIGLSLSSRKVRGGIGVNLGTGIALTFLYIFFMQVSTVFATFGNFPPLLAVWTPNIVFGIIAIFLIRIAPK